MTTKEGTPIGEHIRDWRTRRGYSQRKFAELCDISAVYLCYVEKGRHQPSLDLLFVMARVLQVRPSMRFRVVRKNKPICQEVGT